MITSDELSDVCNEDRTDTIEVSDAERGEAVLP